MRVLIVTLVPKWPGMWGYKAYADTIQYGGDSPAKAVRSAFERRMVGSADEIHVCTDKGIEIKTLKDFGL